MNRGRKTGAVGTPRRHARLPAFRDEKRPARAQPLPLQLRLFPSRSRCAPLRPRRAPSHLAQLLVEALQLGLALARGDAAHQCTHQGHKLCDADNVDPEWRGAQRVAGLRG
jgi:hypothetical protein